MASNTAAPRQFRVSLGAGDSGSLKEIASKLGVNESEVIRKGLQLMALYAKTIESEDRALIYKDGEANKELMVI